MAIDPVEQEIWRRLSEEGDPEARDFLFLRYASWASAVAASVVRRTGHAGMEWADHVQNARIGMLEAMSRYDPARGIDFVAYAKARVRGAVFNGMRAFFRDRGGAGERPSPQERVRSLQDGSGADPLDGFIEAVIGLGIGHLLENEDLSGDPSLDSERHALGATLRDALMGLKRRHREILIAHYFRHVPFQDIARGMGLTKGRISQLHRAALAELRQILRDGRYDRDSFF